MQAPRKMRQPLHLKSRPGTNQSDDLLRIELFHHNNYVTQGRGFRQSNGQTAERGRQPSKKKMAKLKHMSRMERIAYMSFGEALPREPEPHEK